MPVIGRVLCENPDEILNAGAYGAGAIIRVQSSTTETGTYADISGTGSTPTIPVVTLIRAYSLYDPAGTVSTWYRTRYENVGATRLSDWGTAFQVGDETTGQLCSIYDVKQRIGIPPNDTSQDELLFDIIREVSDDIEDYVGQWLAPRPTNPASTTTLLFDVGSNAPFGGWNIFSQRRLLLDRGARLCGIRTLTALGIASTSQPETGGTYSSANIADVFLRPAPTVDAPALRLIFTDYPQGSINLFYPGFNTAQVTGSFGPAFVPWRIQSVAIAAVTRRYIGKEQAAPSVAIGPDGGVRLLADISPAMMATLTRMRLPVGA